MKNSYSGCLLQPPAQLYPLFSVQKVSDFSFFSVELLLLVVSLTRQSQSRNEPLTRELFFFFFFFMCVAAVPDKEVSMSVRSVDWDFQNINKLHRLKILIIRVEPAVNDAESVPFVFTPPDVR